MSTITAFCRNAVRAAADRPSSLLALSAALGAAPLLLVFAMAGDATPRRTEAPAFLSADLHRGAEFAPLRESI